MNEIIEALKIFLKYQDVKYPFHCEHDVLTICGIDPEEVSPTDIVRLNELGFFISDDAFISFKYGSA